MKFASHHLLFYAVYMCQKSSNYVGHSNVTSKNISWYHFSWATLYIHTNEIQLKGHK